MRIFQKRKFFPKILKKSLGIFNSSFKQSLLLRKLSALVSPNGQETLVPVQVFACEKCGNVNSEFSSVSGIQ